MQASRSRCTTRSSLKCAPTGVPAGLTDRADQVAGWGVGYQPPFGQYSEWPQARERGSPTLGRPLLSTSMVLRQLGVPGLEELRTMRRLALRFPERATHAVDLPYRLAWVRPGDPSRVETALWYVGHELVAWQCGRPGRGS